MKLCVILILCLSVMTTFFSCNSSYEARANSAYKAAQKANPGQKKLLHKEAYMMYREVMENHPEKMVGELRNRYIEMTLIRTKTTIDEASYSMDAVPLFIQDLDSLVSLQTPSKLRDQYAVLLKIIADSARINGDIDTSLKYIDKAVSISANPEAFSNYKKLIVKEFTDARYELAKNEYMDWKKSKDSQSLIRAEFYVLQILHYDSLNNNVKKFLSEIRRKNISTLSVYQAVFDEKPNSLVDKFDIYLAVASQKPRARSIAMEVSMYNNSYNPLRLKHTQFYLIDTKGKKYTALSSSKIKKDYLDTEHEGKFNLFFNAPRNKIKKLVYENGDHYTEKYFF